MEPSKPIELEIPSELATAFEVKDAGSGPKADVPIEVKKEKGKKKTKKDAGQMAARPPKAKYPNRRPEVDPLWVGEKVWMDVTWLNTTAGEFLLEVNPFKVINDRKVYDIKGTARTTDIFALIYKAEDTVQSYVDFEGWFPYKFVLQGNESRYLRNHLELFDHQANKQYVHVQDLKIASNEMKEKKGYHDLAPFSQDSLSALYYARTLKLEAGAVLHFPMTTQGKQWDLQLTVIGPEEIKTRMGYLRAIKTKIQTSFNGVLQQNGDAFIWFTEDARKFPVRFEAKVKIGWITGIAKKIETGQSSTGETSGSDGNSSYLESKTKKRKGFWFKDLIERDEAALKMKTSSG